MNNYNFFGAKFLYLLTYVDADSKTFSNIYSKYTSHIRNHHPEPYHCDARSFMDLNDKDMPLYTKAAKCQYACGNENITVYHIFARIPTPNE